MRYSSLWSDRKSNSFRNTERSMMMTLIKGIKSVETSLMMRCALWIERRPSATEPTIRSVVSIQYCVHEYQAYVDLRWLCTGKRIWKAAVHFKSNALDQTSKLPCHGIRVTSNSITSHKTSPPKTICCHHIPHESARKDCDSMNPWITILSYINRIDRFSLLKNTWKWANSVHTTTFVQLHLTPGYLIR
jgi:hypothetical protein